VIQRGGGKGGAVPVGSAAGEERKRIASTTLDFSKKELMPSRRERRLGVPDSSIPPRRLDLLAS
jgi:hypothetical protein